MMKKDWRRDFIKDRAYKRMIREIIKQIKCNEICLFQEINGTLNSEGFHRICQIDEMKTEPCDRILIIGILTGPSKIMSR